MNIHYNYYRPYTAYRDQPPATRTPARVTNVMRCYNLGRRAPMASM